MSLSSYVERISLDFVLNRCIMSVAPHLKNGVFDLEVKEPLELYNYSILPEGITLVFNLYKKEDPDSFYCLERILQYIQNEDIKDVYFVSRGIKFLYKESDIFSDEILICLTIPCKFPEGIKLESFSQLTAIEYVSASLDKSKLDKNVNINLIGNFDVELINIESPPGGGLA